MDVGVRLQMPTWVLRGDKLQVCLDFHNREAHPVWVNRRAATGHQASGADLLLDLVVAPETLGAGGRNPAAGEVDEVASAGERRVRTAHRIATPPSLSDFFQLPAGMSVRSTISDIAGFYRLAPGRYVARARLEALARVPPELAGHPVFRDEVWLPPWPFAVAREGAPSPLLSPARRARLRRGEEPFTPADRRRMEETAAAARRARRARP
jgi:hypothetical protein